MTAFPMKIDRKKAREELDVINIVEWRRDITSDERLFLLIKRPMTGKSNLCGLKSDRLRIF